MSGTLAKTRLMHERKSFRKDHPVGFFARPATDANGEANLFRWCVPRFFARPRPLLTCTAPNRPSAAREQELWHPRSG